MKLKTLVIPGSKSHAIRAIVIALFSRSVCTIHNVPQSEDIRTCLEAAKTLGASYKRKGKTVIIDSENLKENDDVTLCCNNSGTTLFFLTALCSTLNGKITFTGDESLSKRSSENLLNSLKDLGVKVEGTNLPYTLQGPLKGGRTKIDCPTSQFLSALLLACPLAKRKCVVEVGILNEKPYVEMTEKYLKKNNIRYTVKDKTYRIKPRQKFSCSDVTIPCDYSSALPFFAAAAILNKTIKINNLFPDDSQADSQALDILVSMGCTVKRTSASLVFTGCGKLKAVDMNLNALPDSLPVLAVTACFADNCVRIKNVSHARLKESDRIHCMAVNLRKLGVKTEEFEDGLLIHPVKEFKEAEVDTFKDHRIAMALAVASLKCETEIIIKDKDCVGVSFPSFYKVFEGVKK